MNFDSDFGFFTTSLALVGTLGCFVGGLSGYIVAVVFLIWALYATR